MMRAATTLAAVAALAAQSACSGAVDDPAPDIQFGSVNARWTIDGSADPSKCAEHAAARIQIVMLDAADLVRARADAPCENLEVSITVANGEYRARAAFVDASDRRVSVPLEVPPFSVASGGVTLVPLAFTSDMMDVKPVEPV